MAITKDVHDKVADILNALVDFRDVVKGVVPSPAQVKKFPSLAIDYAIVRRKEANVQNVMDVKEEIDIYLYNQQKHNKHEDILSDLIHVVDLALQQDQWLKDNCISHFVSEIVTSGGLEGGGRITARLTLYLSYQERCVV